MARGLRPNKELLLSAKASKPRLVTPVVGKRAGAAAEFRDVRSRPVGWAEERDRGEEFPVPSPG